MVTTRSKARLLEQATNDRGSNERTEGAQDTTHVNQHPVGAVVYRGAARGAADNNASSHSENTESNGALPLHNPIENKSSSTGSDSADTTKAKHTTSDDGHAQDPSDAPATVETNVSDKPEVLSDATSKVAAKSNTNAANSRTKPHRKRGRRPTRPKSKKHLSVADDRVQHHEVLEVADCTGAGSTPVDIDRPPEAEMPTNHLPSNPHANQEALTALPSRALPSNKGKGKAVASTESSEGCSQGTSDEKIDAADALLQLWTSRPPAECRVVRPSSTDEPTAVAESSTQPRRSYRLEKKKEKKEEERQEKERLEKERQEKERQEKEGRAKRTRSTGNKADDTTMKRKGKGKRKGPRTPTPRATDNATKRKREVVEVEDAEDATEDSSPRRKRVALRPTEQAQNGTEHPTHDRYFSASCSESSFGSGDAFESPDVSETGNASGAIDVGGMINASPTMGTLEPFDVKERIRNYMEVSTLRRTLQVSGYEDPLDGDDASSPVPTFRRIIPPPSRFGFPPQPYYVAQPVPMQLGNIWRPATWRQ